MPVNGSDGSRLGNKPARAGLSPSFHMHLTFTFLSLATSRLVLPPSFSQDTFIAQTKTIAGFEDNANYGFGANQMTGSQKNLLIFGSLAAFFVLFLAGYALE